RPTESSTLRRSSRASAVASGIELTFEIGTPRADSAANWEPPPELLGVRDACLRGREALVAQEFPDAELVAHRLDLALLHRRRKHDAVAGPECIRAGRLRKRAVAHQ